MAIEEITSDASELILIPLDDGVYQLVAGGDIFLIDSKRPASVDIPENDWGVGSVLIPVLNGPYQESITGDLADLFFMLQHSKKIGLTFAQERGNTIPTAVSGLFANVQ